MFSDMIVNSPRDLWIFSSVIVCGACVGVMFDVFRAFRKIHTPGAVFLSFQDALFCALAFWAFSHTVSVCADGDLRWFVIAGFLIGIALYFFTIGRFVFLCVEKTFFIIRKVIFDVLKFFKKIFLYITKPFLCVFEKIKSVFSLKFAKMRKNSSQKRITVSWKKKFSKKSLQEYKNSL